MQGHSIPCCPRSACLHRCCGGAMPACNRHARPGHAAGSASRMIHVVLQAVFAAKVRRPRACPAAVGAGSSQHHCGVSRLLVGTAAAVAHVVCVVWDAGGAGRGCGVCSPSSRRCCSRTVRTAFRRAVRGRRRAERRLVGWLVQRSRTGCCSLRPRRAGRKCRRAPCPGTRATAGAPARLVEIVWVAPPLGLGRSRRVREGRRGAGAAAVEGSS